MVQHATWPRQGSEQRAHTWGWVESFSIQLTVLLLAAAAHRLLGPLPVLAFPPPWNWLILGGLILAGIAAGCLCGRQGWVRWLAGVPFAVVNIAFVACLGVLGALIAQDAARSDLLAAWGMRAVFTALPFIAAILMMLLNLALAVGRRLLSRAPRTPGFLLTHLGMLVVLLGMLAGPSQHSATWLHLREGESASTVRDARGHTLPLGATVTLQRFSIEKYPPKLAVVQIGADAHAAAMATDTAWAATGHAFSAHGITVHIRQFIPSAFPGERDTWVPSEQHGVPAAFIRITAPGLPAKEGWVTPEVRAVGIPPRPLYFDATRLVGLLEPPPKSFRSDLDIAAANGAIRHATLEVNRPVRVGHWQLYQSSYQLGMGGRMSIMQVVRDPALPVVYTGLICLALGSMLALWWAPQRRPQDDAPRADAEEERPA